ncbi:MAG: SUKH-4 family immunity protein [Blastocatellia bacterium]|nr:SUKH-4 family immunity protein [Blastocatellia bacterium]
MKQAMAMRQAMGMEDRKIIEFWGDGNLLRWKEENVKHSAIPQTAKAFLITVGLPRSETWSIKFDNGGTLLYLSERRFYKIGSDDDLVPICIDEISGYIVSIEDGDLRFINSTIELFCESLVYYHEYRESTKNIPEDDNIYEIIKLTEEKLKATDPSGFSNNNSWWPVIIEQMHHGFL